MLNIIRQIKFKYMPKISKSSAKKATTKTKKASKVVKKTVIKKKIETPIKISKIYLPKDAEKYMCEKHKVFFRIRLTEWKKDLVKANNEALYYGSMDDNSVSADVVDQAIEGLDRKVIVKLCVSQGFFRKRVLSVDILKATHTSRSDPPIRTP